MKIKLEFQISDFSNIYKSEHQQALQNLYYT
jgi:hypothetical protein